MKRSAVSRGSAFERSRTVSALVVAAELSIVMVGGGPFAKAAEPVSGAVAAQEPEGSPVTQKPPVRVQHRRTGCLMRGRYPQFEATIQPVDDVFVARARLYFSSAWDDQWWFTEMVRDGAVFRGWLLKPELEASPVSYYILATFTDFTEEQTHEYQAVVVKDVADCEADEVIAPTVRRLPKKFYVFSAATGFGSPQGFKQ